LVETEGFLKKPAGPGSDREGNGRGADIPGSARKRLRSAPAETPSAERETRRRRARPALEELAALWNLGPAPAVAVSMDITEQQRPIDDVVEPDTSRDAYVVSDMQGIPVDIRQA
jgi:hypothetical protein